MREMSEKVLPGGHWREVPGKFKKHTHSMGSVPVYVRVLNGHSSSVDPNATALRNQGKCHGNFFQGVTGGHFQESSISECLPPVNVNNNTQKGNVREGSSRGSLEESSRKVQEVSTYSL